MRLLNAAGFAGVLLLAQFGRASAPAKAAKVFLLEDASSNQWCAYAKEADWNAAVQDTGAMTVAALTYSNDHLLQIDVTETDETGDWTVYDHFFLDDHGQIVRLSRLINVLPGDRSVLQGFSIGNGKANRTATTEAQLSTGKQLVAPKSVWLPDLPIATGTKMFPFSVLLARPRPWTGGKSCVQVPAPQK
jgi:hypothetical protein